MYTPRASLARHRSCLRDWQNAMDLEQYYARVLHTTLAAFGSSTTAWLAFTEFSKRVTHAPFTYLEQSLPALKELGLIICILHYNVVRDSSQILPGNSQEYGGWHQIVESSRILLSVSALVSAANVGSSCLPTQI